MHNGTFRRSFKISEVIPVYKKDEPNLSKIYERYMHDEINAYFDDILSNFNVALAKAIAHNIACYI